MTLPIANPLLPRPTRRQFLTTAAAGLALWQCGESACSQITGLAMPKLAAYDDLMTAFMREHKPPGAALAVTYHGRLVYARGFGYANLEKHEPVRPDFAVSHRQLEQALHRRSRHATDRTRQTPT